MNGLAINAYIVADIGERIVAYIDELGRFEGVVTRRGEGWFAIETPISRGRIERLSQKLSALSGERGDFAGSNTAESQTGTAELRTEFGQSFIVDLADMTRIGVRVIANFKLLRGSRVKIGPRPGAVVRETTDGFVVEFDQRAS